MQPQFGVRSPALSKSLFPEVFAASSHGPPSAKQGARTSGLLEMPKSSRILSDVFRARLASPHLRSLGTRVSIDGGPFDLHDALESLPRRNISVSNPRTRPSFRALASRDDRDDFLDDLFPPLDDAFGASNEPWKLLQEEAVERRQKEPQGIPRRTDRPSLPRQQRPDRARANPGWGEGDSQPPGSFETAHWGRRPPPQPDSWQYPAAGNAYPSYPARSRDPPPRGGAGGRGAGRGSVPRREGPRWGSGQPEDEKGVEQEEGGYWGRTYGGRGRGLGYDRPSTSAEGGSEGGGFRSSSERRGPAGRAPPFLSSPDGGPTSRYPPPYGWEERSAGRVPVADRLPSDSKWDWPGSRRQQQQQQQHQFARVRRVGDAVPRTPRQYRGSWEGSPVAPPIVPESSAFVEEQENVRRVLNRFIDTTYRDCGVLSEEDTEFVVKNVLRFHPQAREILGAGIEAIRVHFHPKFPTSRCFYFRAHGRSEWVHFSVPNCLSNRLPRVNTRPSPTADGAPPLRPNMRWMSSRLREEHWQIRRALYAVLHAKYPAGSVLNDMDKEYVITNVLRYHPRASEKMGAGVEAIKVDYHPKFKDTKCFWVKKVDEGEWDDFSYLKCLDSRFASAFLTETAEVSTPR